MPDGIGGAEFDNIFLRAEREVDTSNEQAVLDYFTETANTQSRKALGQQVYDAARTTRALEVAETTLGRERGRTSISREEISTSDPLETRKLLEERTQRLQQVIVENPSKRIPQARDINDSLRQEIAATTNLTTNRTLSRRIGLQEEFNNLSRNEQLLEIKRGIQSPKTIANVQGISIDKAQELLEEAKSIDIAELL